ncbi:MAG: hypothetical protein ABGW90_13745, partial [Martelella sp.]
NRSSQPGEIAEAILEIAADMLFSLTGGDRQDMKEVAPLYALMFQFQLERKVTGKGIRPAAHVAPVFEPGGHA